MNCPEFQQHVQELLDGQPAGAEGAREHARHCPSCRELFTAAEMLRGLPQRRELLPPAGFVGRVVTAVLRERARQVRLRWWSVSAAAAAILMGVGLWSLAGGFSRSSVSPDVVKMDAPPSKLEPPAPPSLSQARAVGRATLERTRQAAENAARQASILMPPTRELTAPQVSLAVNPAEVPIGDMGKSVSDGLEPVTKSTRRAFDVWLDMLPMGSDEKPGT